MKSRFLSGLLNKHIRSSMGRIIVLTGARQTGKTTLARHSFPEYNYLSIEDPIMRMEYKKLTATQWKELYPKAILDEVQKEAILIESIKSAYDQYPEVRYLLLGSSQLLLLEKVKESLAGRCIIEEVFPLTLPELLTNEWKDEIRISVFQELLINGVLQELSPSFRMLPDYSKRQSVFEYYLQYGGYPALVHPEMTDESRFLWLQNYVRTYLERDIRDLAEFRLLEPFVKTQHLSALLTGQLINYTNLSKDVGITSKTVKRFINYLEISYQVIMLQPWFGNKIKRLVKSPKLHYLDPGVHRAIINKRGALNGHEYESAVIAEMYKQMRTAKVNARFLHLRSHSGMEIDLLVELENGYLAFEVKNTESVDTKDARHLRSLAGKLDKPLLYSFVLSNSPDIKELSENVWALPSAYFLS